MPYGIFLYFPYGIADGKALHLANEYVLLSVWYLPGLSKQFILYKS